MNTLCPRASHSSLSLLRTTHYQIIAPFENREDGREDEEERESGSGFTSESMKS